MRLAHLHGLRLILPSVLLGLLATTAQAGGVAVRWDQCYGDGGTINRNFACNTNSGTNALICSFMLDQDINYPTDAQMVFGVATASGSLSEWWSFKNLGTCRSSSLSTNFSIPTAVNCPDWMNGQGAGAVAAYEVGAWGPSSARIIVAAAVPGLIADLFAGQEYSTLRLRIDNAKTVGSGACSGCVVPACIVLQSIRLSDSWLPQGVRVLTSPLNGTDSHYATWQGGGTPTSSLGAGCPAATPTRRGTWGGVKALYR